MSKALVVVESPTKVRTIKKYLGSNYNVSSTVGHLKDLPKKEMGIEIENDFTPQYDVIPGKQKVIKTLKNEAKGAVDIYLAPDPDREGEAIAWHTYEILNKKGRKFHRVLFHELTKKSVLEAINSPIDLNTNKYEAQKARRVLDRLVGYQISPLLWKKVKNNLSAGRVQSVAVRIICERERAIYAFEKEEYWSIAANLKANEPPEFSAKLVKKDKKKIKISNEKSSNEILKELGKHKIIVEKIANKLVKRNPLPPFITSKLQQEAIRKLRFSAKKTMIVAQQLYEGVDLGPGEPEGLITYMRTDSTRIAQEAAEEALQFIGEKYGNEYALKKPRFFKNKKKAQDAHEAIRPTSVYNTPERVAAHLSFDQNTLYSLIWKRFVASQMTEALINQNTISITVGPYLFTTTGSTIKFLGFMSLYMSADAEIENKKEKQMLPPLTENMELKLVNYEPKQHFTMPPPRFSEASLVKELEENGIGRPSTYATILSTIRDKGYVELINRYFIPTELGFIVNDLLVKNFSNIFDVDFTAKLENNLDSIESAEANFVDILNRFYNPFKKDVDNAVEKMLSMRGVGVQTGIKCPNCTGELHIKVGKNGHYLACNKYPDCTYSSNYTRDEKGKILPVEQPKDEISDEKCEKCGKPLLIKHGKFGKFLACSGYPECKNTRSFNLLENGEVLGIKCPSKDCKGNIVEKKSRRGKIFYACNNYPKCNFALWDKPVDKKCPDCNSSYLLEKQTKKEGSFLICPNKDCGHKELLN